MLAAAGTPTGIALIAGTGSVAWGRSPDGRQARAGGWGYLLGDDGSGYGIARAAVRHALGRLDAGLGPDPLSTRLAAACGVARPGLLLDHFYAVSERRYWAERSRAVFELAEAGDPAAYGIVAGAAGALAALVERVSLRLAIAGPVILAGGVLVHQPLVRAVAGRSARRDRHHRPATLGRGAGPRRRPPRRSSRTASAVNPQSPTSQGETPTMTQPGALMAAEIIEQPDVWRRLLTEGREQFDTVAERIAAVRSDDGAVRRPRHQRPRRPVRQVPDRDRGAATGRPGLPVHHDRVRRPARAWSGC